jgi:hypothetical protein
MYQKTCPVCKGSTDTDPCDRCTLIASRSTFGIKSYSKEFLDFWNDGRPKIEEDELPTKTPLSEYFKILLWEAWIRGYTKADQVRKAKAI